MYNDYYLEQIYDRIGTTIQNQETIINDNTEIKESIQNLNIITTTILFVIVIKLLYHFIERCFRC